MPISDLDGDVRALAVAKIAAIFNMSSTRGIQKDKGKQGKRGSAKGSTAKNSAQQESGVRVFEIPKPVYSAKNYYSMISWDTEQVTVPPFVRDLSLERIKGFEQKPLVLNVASNTQHVERLIQLNAKVGPKSASSIGRDGLVHLAEEN